MARVEDGGPPHPDLENSHRVRIGDLSHSVVDDSAYVEAQIALVWPYSSSTRQYAFLLSETDTRPLKSGRQLKVILHNGAARAVQNTRVGIGDRIRLSLRGAVPAEAHDKDATPGRRYGWDLEYRDTIVLEVSRHGRYSACADIAS
jgi:hypothetical protein